MTDSYAKLRNRIADREEKAAKRRKAKYDAIYDRGLAFREYTNRYSCLRYLAPSQAWIMYPEQMSNLIGWASR